MEHQLLLVPHPQRSIALLCALLLAFPNSATAQQSPPKGQPPAGQPSQASSQPLPAEQLDSLVAPIALYPDPLLSQILVASTYPLEIVQVSRWLQANSTLKGKDLTDAVAKQPWDASVQALVVFPDVLKRLDEGIDWTAALGNAFLAQQSGVMDAVQRLRAKAQKDGKLQSTEQQKVTTSSSNNTTYIEIQPASTQVIYVPQYDPMVVWGAAPLYYPYPPVAYPYYPYAGVVAATAISFGVGMAIGAMWSGGWGWGCGWGGGSVNINNNFMRNNNFNGNISGGNRGNIGSGDRGNLGGGDRVNHRGSNNWQHNPAHREGVPYGNRDVANRFNDNNRGNGARDNRPSAGQTQQRLGQGDANRLGQGGAGQRNQGSANRDVGRQGGGDRVGNRQAGGGNFGGGGSGRSAFGDMGGGGSRARSNGSRGMSSRGGGGRRR